MVMRRQSKGARMFRAALDELEVTAAQAGAELCPRSPSMVYKWLEGSVQPGLGYAFAISAAYGVPADAWLEYDEVEET